MNWLFYLLEANIYLGVFYLAYCLLLQRSTHYQLSRAYLIFSCVVSFVLPVLQVSSLKHVKQAEVAKVVPHDVPVMLNIQQMPVIPMTAATTPSSEIPSKPEPVEEHHITFQDYLWYAYLAGAAILLVVLLVKLIALFRLMRKKPTTKEGKYRVVYLPGADIAFSFFNYLFIGDKTPEAGTIITHELVHIRQKHSADIIFLELLKIVNWFNPFIYLLQNSLKTVHEYIADEQTAAQGTDVLTYASFLLNNAYGSGGLSVTHSFFNYNLLKKRIIMLNQQRSGKLARLKYLVAIPICAALLCVSTLAFSKSYCWVDLAPAKAKNADNYVLNTNRLVKVKRLKVTQNGVTTVTDMFSVNQKDKKVTYTAATITAADKSQLLKKHHIKIEVVEDSSAFKTADGRPMLPVVNADGYHQLDHFLHNNISFKPAKGDKGGLVEIGFSLNKDQHVIDPKVVKSGGDKLDALALDGFKAYKGVVTDAPGKNYKIGVYFFTDNYSIFKTDSLGTDKEFAGEVIITDYKFPVAHTSKGYEFEESSMGDMPGNGVHTTKTKVLIYEKNGEATWYYQPKCTPTDLQMLKDKYGYMFPSGETEIVQFFNKDIKKSRLAYIYIVPSYLNDPYAEKLYKHVVDTIQYPEAAKKALKAGVVVLNFNLDNDGVIKDVKVAQSAGNGFDEEAVKGLQSYQAAISDKPGAHSIAIVFCLVEKQLRPAVSDKFKKDGYVGELAVVDARSPFSGWHAK